MPVHPDPATIRDLLQAGYRYAWTLTQDRDAAEDLLHDACLSLARGSRPWSRGLLFRAIKHRCIDAHRRRERTVAEARFDAAGLAEYAEDSSEDGVLARLIQTDEVEHALSRLSDTEREVVYLAWCENYTAREIARAVSRPRNTVLSVLHRARQKLRVWLQTSDQSRRAGS